MSKAEGTALLKSFAIAIGWCEWILGDNTLLGSVHNDHLAIMLKVIAKNGYSIHFICTANAKSLV